MYNYYEAVKEDVQLYIEEHMESLTDLSKTEIVDYLNDTLWLEDSVTGNASGSYFCNAWKAEEALSHNWDLIKEAFEAFGYDSIDLDSLSPESIDVTIRCYLLSSVIYDLFN